MNNAKTAITAKRKLSKRGRETEERFLNAANEVFWEIGFAGSKIVQIVTAGNLSVGSFYHLFADKSELLERASERLLADFHTMSEGLDLSRSANADVFTLLYRLSYSSRVLIRRHRGIYRATAELAQNDFSRYGAIQTIAPTMVKLMMQVMPEYDDQLDGGASLRETSNAVQLIAMAGLQTELGMGPLFPQDVDGYAKTIARAACGVLRYTGQIEGPSMAITGVRYDDGF